MEAADGVCPQKQTAEPSSHPALAQASCGEATIKSNGGTIGHTLLREDLKIQGRRQPGERTGRRGPPPRAVVACVVASPRIWVNGNGWVRLLLNDRTSCHWRELLSGPRNEESPPCRETSKLALSFAKDHWLPLEQLRSASQPVALSPRATEAAELRALAAPLVARARRAWVGRRTLRA